MYGLDGDHLHSYGHLRWLPADLIRASFALGVDRRGRGARLSMLRDFGAVTLHSSAMLQFSLCRRGLATVDVVLDRLVFVLTRWSIDNFGRGPVAHF